MDYQFVTRSAEQIAVSVASGIWPAIEKLTRRFSRPFAPVWSDSQRSVTPSSPTLGIPRQTDSLCPSCVKALREEILAGRQSLDVLRQGNPAGIKAQILERDGRVIITKHCAEHGSFEDVLSIDPAFTTRLEGLFGSRDFESPPTPLHDHGSSSIRYGRGAVLTVDLTNRCNMMCQPCFTNANQVGLVHELEWEDIEKILDDSLTISPRRQMTVQFSGGEPTLSPHFFRALSHARALGYISIQAATNGIRFATEPGFAKEAKAAGLRLAYLQFDGVGNDANQHRKVTNLFDVKQKAIEEMRKADIDVVLVTTIVNSVNDDQVGRVLDFAIDNIDVVTTIAYQPVSFTGRDEDISDELRAKRRYTLSHLARDLAHHTGYLDPLRDWFPLSALSFFADLTDTILGPNQQLGSINCGCHPNCGSGTILLVHKETKETVPLSRVLDMDHLLEDLRLISNANSGKAATIAQLAVSLLRHYKPSRAPRGFDIKMMIQQLLSQIGAIGLGVDDAAQFPWRALFIGGMWFQDLFTYDFRRTEMCIVPYGTQMGQISFCAYNTGIGWRHFVEKAHATETLAHWHQSRGRHKIYSDGGPIPLPSSPTVASAPAVISSPCDCEACDETSLRQNDNDLASDVPRCADGVRGGGQEMDARRCSG